MIILHTNYGNITIALNPEKAPKTVENFLEYVNTGFYDGTIFHRVIKNFVIQGGGYEPNFQYKKPNAPIENEANNGLRNEKGSLSMARTMDPNSASSQFFINLADNQFLDHQEPTMEGWGYCVFGKVTEGMEVVERIAQVATRSKDGHENVPVEDAIIERVEVVAA